MKSFLRRVIANLIIISIILADFLPLGIGLVSLAQEGDAIDYSVRFVEITNNTEPLETEEDSENIEEVPVLEGTSSNVYYKEDFSLLGVTDSKDVAQDEETQIEDIKDEVITNNEENLPDGPAIEIRIKVNSKGYLKNGKVEIKNYESQMFSIRDDAKKDINIYSITDNKIKLNQINNNQEFIAYVPISIKDEKAIDMENLHAGTTFAFMATYVGENGYEQIVSMNENAILNINNDYPINMNCFVEKYIPFVEEENKKAIVQIKLIGGMVGNQVLPAKNTSYEVFLPTIEGVEIQDVNVFAVSTAYTNSLVDSSVQFSVENWEFSYGKITINVENNPQDGLYYKSVGNDEFIISFIYSGELDGKEELLSSKATMKAEIYSSDGMIEKAYQEDYSLNLLEANKSIITYEVSGKTKEISKGYLIGNLNREVEDRAVEYENTLNVNISRVELLKTIHISETKEYFEDEMGNQYPTLRNDNADSFYKEIKVNKTNLENILGDKGSLELRNRENTLITINKETPDDGDGFIRVAFGDNVIDTLEFVINAPEADGILNITAVKNIFKPTYNKLDIKNFKAIVAEYSATATLDLDTETNMGSTNVVTFLKDTMTDAKLAINKEELSTLVTNEGIELTLALNNATEESDMYSNPVFEIVFPEEIKQVDITDYNLLYGNEELSIKNVESLITENGQIMLKISLEGRQTTFTAGDSDDGTKVILKANIKTDLFEASKSSKIIMNYYNEDATEYGISNVWNMESDPSIYVMIAETGYAEIPVKIVAPQGMVNVTSYTNYNEDRTVMSINQGFKEDYIETFEDYRVAKNSIISINNTGMNLEGFKILGRTAFEGNTHIVNNNPIGTNMTAPMISKINPIKTRNKLFTIYYSNKADATADLEVLENEWVLEPDDLRNVKSYLIITNDTILKGDSFVFEYDFEIPNNLKNQIDIASTFATCYQEETEKVWNEADKVMLTTGEMPTLEAVTYSNIDLETANEGQRIEYTTKVTNTGNVVAKNVDIECLIPDGTTFVKDGLLDKEITVLMYNIPQIKPQETVFKTYEVEVNSIEKQNKKVYIEPKSYVKADGIEQKIEAYVQNSMLVTKSDVYLDIDSDKNEKIIGENETITYMLKVSNVDALEIKNAQITVEIPDGIEILDSFEELYSGEVASRGNGGNYDPASKKIYWHIDDLGLSRTFKIEAKTRFIEEKTKEIPLTYKLKSDSLNKEYISNAYEKTIGKPVLETKVYANTNSKYVKEGEKIQFVLNLKNIGGICASNLNLENIVPSDFRITEVSYLKNGEKLNSLAVQNTNVNVDLEIGEETQVVVNCVANNILNTEAEKLTNIGWSISAANIHEEQTEKIQTIIEQNPEVPDNTYEGVIPEKTEQDTRYEVVLNKEEETQTKKYRITGMAFEDLNKNGEFDKDESVLENVVAKLCDAKNQKIIDQTVTNKAGEYLFENLDKGEYYVKFEFDKEYYGITSYKKNGIRENKNSDAILSNGKAVTDKIKIKDKSISDINIGLAKTGVFDLEIDANIQKMTIYKGDETISYNAKNGKLARFTKNNENLANTVEYDIKVTNKGEIPGYAKQIKCDLSEKLVLNDDINPAWYSGTDGNIYSTALGDTLLNPGETKTIKLYLYKDNNEEGLYSNKFEISREYNEYAIEDTNINNNKSDVNYVIEKSKTMSFVAWIVGIIVVLGMLIVILYIAKYFMESRIAKEYAEIEKEHKE